MTPLEQFGKATRCRGPERISRRRMLQVGSLGLMGISLPRLLEAREKAPPGAVEPAADACIVIFLNGGPSHLDMWDMKPAAAEGIRGEFKPIATSLPGYTMCELLPRLAQQMHRWTVIRSMHHGVNNAHAAAVYAALTGHDRGEIGGGARPDDNPSPGSVLAMLRPPPQTIVPHVTLPYITKEGAAGPPQPGFFGGYLGRSYDPLFVLADPNREDFAVTELMLTADVSLQRLAARRTLFDHLDRHLQQGLVRAPLEAMDSFQHRALALLTSESTERAFRISDEAVDVRDRYGRNIYGQSVLLARRLIEAGTRFACVTWAPDANATWDTHGGNFRKLKSQLLPQFDAAASSLVDDLAQRGLLERTMVAVLGDFGRTPKVNQSAGRDHWNYCYSIMLCGGGLKEGFVYGQSDKIGAFPASNPLSPGDMISTIYHLLGIAPDRLLHDRLGRPHRLVPTGDVVDELLA